MEKILSLCLLTTLAWPGIFAIISLFKGERAYPQKLLSILLAIFITGTSSFLFFASISHPGKSLYLLAAAFLLGWLVTLSIMQYTCSRPGHGVILIMSGAHTIILFFLLSSLSKLYIEQFL